MLSGVPTEYQIIAGVKRVSHDIMHLNLVLNTSKLVKTNLKSPILILEIIPMIFNIFWHNVKTSEFNIFPSLQESSHPCHIATGGIKEAEKLNY